MVEFMIDFFKFEVKKSLIDWIIMIVVFASFGVIGSVLDFSNPQFFALICACISDVLIRLKYFIKSKNKNSE